MPKYIAFCDTICDREGTNRPECHINPVVIDSVVDDLQDINEPTHDVKLS